MMLEKYVRNWLKIHFIFYYTREVGIYPTGNRELAEFKGIYHAD